MLSLEKIIKNLNDDHDNKCWICTNVKDVDMITKIATLKFCGYKDKSTFNAGRRFNDIKEFKVDISTLQTFEPMFLETMMLVISKGDFEGAKIVDTNTID